MPSPLTISSSSTSSSSSGPIITGPNNNIGHHLHHHHLQHQQSNPLNTIHHHQTSTLSSSHHPHHLSSIHHHQTGLQPPTSQSSSSANTPHHHAVMAAHSTAAAAAHQQQQQMSALAMVAAAAASSSAASSASSSHATAVHHLPGPATQTPTPLTSLQHTHLSHGHLLHEIYDRSNKRPRITGGTGTGGDYNNILDAMRAGSQQQMVHQMIHGLTTGQPSQPPPGSTHIGGYPHHLLVGSTGSSSATTTTITPNHHGPPSAPPHLSGHHLSHGSGPPQSSHLLSSHHQSPQVAAAAAAVMANLHPYSVQPQQQHGKMGGSGGLVVIDELPSVVHGQHPQIGGKSSSSSLMNQAPSLKSNQELLIETIDDNGEDGYNPHFEAISPTPNDESRVSPLTSLKDQILSSIHSCDRQIQTVEAHINKLRFKAQQLEAVTRNPPTDLEEQVQKNGMREPTLVQKIYQENSMKAKRAHQQFNNLLWQESNVPLNSLPLYNQPIDLEITHEIRESYLQIRKSLIERIRKRKQEKILKDKMVAERYDQQMVEWLKKVEKIELNPAKKQRDAKIREYFEKQFPELKKQREDRERLQRGAQRIRSEAELEEIMDGLQVQELEDKKMRSYVVIPPIMYSEEERRQHVRFDNKNGFLKDPMALNKELKMVNIWTESEKEIFKEKYLMNPKKFGVIAQFLERKSIADCIQYYYMSKKNEHYKQILLRKHAKKRTRAMMRQQQQLQQQNLVNNSGAGGNRGSPLVQQTASAVASGGTNTVPSSANGTEGVDQKHNNNPLSKLGHHNAATTFILPYSQPLTSSSTTITFTMPPSDQQPQNPKLSSTISNGPLVNNGITVPTSNSSSNKCDNNGDNNSWKAVDDNATTTSSPLVTTNGASTADGLETIPILVNNNATTVYGCSLCSDKIREKCSYVLVSQQNFHIYGLSSSSSISSVCNGGTHSPSSQRVVCFRCHVKKNPSGTSASTTNAQITKGRRRCPILSCSSTRIKRLKALPQQWLEMPEELKRTFAEELDIPMDAKVGCPRCLMRIGRRIGLVSNNRQQNNSSTESKTNDQRSTLPSDSNKSKEECRKKWPVEDVDRLRSLIKVHGKDWETIGSLFQPAKTSKDCQKCFQYFKNEFQLLSALKDYYNSVGRLASTTNTTTAGADDETTDGGDDDMTMSDLTDDTADDSLDGTPAIGCASTGGNGGTSNNHNNNESDTASASSSQGGKQDLELQQMAATIAGSSSGANKSNLQDFKPLSLSQGSLKSDYDSSATMSADESSNANDNNTNSGNNLDRTGKLDQKNEDLLSSLKTSSSMVGKTNTGSSKDSSATSLAGPLCYDAPQVPMFLINPNAPSVQINNSASINHHPTSSSTTTPTTAGHHRTPPPPRPIQSSSEFSSTQQSSVAPSSSTTSLLSQSSSSSSAGGGSGTCVRDLIYKAIEKSLQTECRSSSIPSSVSLTNSTSSIVAPTTLASSDSTHHSVVVSSAASSSSQYPLCLSKRDLPSSSSSMAIPPMLFQQTSSNLHSLHPNDLTKMDLLTAAAAAAQRQKQQNLLNLSGNNAENPYHKPEGLMVGLNLPGFGQPPPSSAQHPEPDVCEVQDLSNKSKDRSSSRSYDLQLNRNSPKDHPLGLHGAPSTYGSPLALNHPHNKIMKLEHGQLGRSSPLQLPPVVKSPSFPSDQQQRTFSSPFSQTNSSGGSIQPAHSNSSQQRITNMIDAFMSSPDHPGKSSSSSNRPQPSPYSSLISQQSSLKINSSKSPQLPPNNSASTSTTFPISPKTEQTIRDKMIVGGTAGGGSITQGTPVVGQPPPSHTPTAHQQQQAALAALNAAAMAAVSGKFPPPPPPSATTAHPSAHHPGAPPPPAGAFHPAAVAAAANYDIFRQMMSNDCAKGSITQGTPFIIQPPPPTLPLMPASSSGSSGHHQSSSSSNTRNSKSLEALDFAAGGKRNSSGSSNRAYPELPKSGAPSMTYDLIERMATFHQQQQQQQSQSPHSLYRPFSPNYAAVANKQPPTASSGTNKDSSSHISQIYIDFNTSKQMQPRRSSASSEKDIVVGHSDRLIPPPTAPSAPPPGILDQDRDRPSSKSSALPSGHHRTTPFQISPSPSPSAAAVAAAALYQSMPDREKAALAMAAGADPSLLQWNSLTLGPMSSNPAFLNRQNVIQQCYNNPSVSKGSSSGSVTSVIQSAPPTTSSSSLSRDFLIRGGSTGEDIITSSLKNSMLNQHHFASEHEPLQTLVNAAVQQQSLSVSAPPSASSSIQSRLTKEGFEKCFSESLAPPALGPPSSSTTKQIISNRIIYPPIGGLPINETGGHGDLITDLSQKSKLLSDSDGLKSGRNRDHTSSRPPSTSSGGDNLMDLSKRFPPAPSPFGIGSLPPHLSEQEKQQLLLLNEQQQKNSKQPNAPKFSVTTPNYAAEIHLQLQQQAAAFERERELRERSSSSSSSSSAHRVPEQLLAAPGYPPSSASITGGNPGLKFARESPFSQENFERELHKQKDAAARELQQLKTTEKSEGRKSQNPPPMPPPQHNETTMDEASKLFSQSFQKDSQPNSGGISGGITAANLIDAIITKQINTDSTKGSLNLGGYSSRIKPSPSTTPTPNKSLEPGSGSGGLDFSKTSTIASSGLMETAGNRSLRDTIFSMITDNIQNTPTSASSTSVIGPNRKNGSGGSGAIFEGIAAAAVTNTSNSQGNSAENFKLRRALQDSTTAGCGEFPNKRPALDVPTTDSLNRQQVIQMATGATSTTSTSNSNTAASPSLSGPPNLKHLSQYIEPISPPPSGQNLTTTVGTTSSSTPVTTAASALQSNLSWTGFWPFIHAPQFYGSTGAAVTNSKQQPSVPSSQQQATAPPVSSASESSAPGLSHLPGHHESPSFISNKIAEAMQRGSTNEDDKTSSKSNMENNSRATTPNSKKSDDKTINPSSSSSSENLLTTSGTSSVNESSNSNRITAAYPDSPNSPGEMVIDENCTVSPTPPSPPPQLSSDAKPANNSRTESSKNSSGGVIKLNNELSNTDPQQSSTIGSSSSATKTSETSIANDSKQPQFEPLSDDDEPN